MTDSTVLPHPNEGTSTNDDFSDGYHTMSELYSHRHLLSILLFNLEKEKSFKTKRNKEGEIIEGWFIAGMESEFGQISYHFPTECWHLLDVKVKVCDDTYDGHTSMDVEKRLLKIIEKSLENQCKDTV